MAVRLNDPAKRTRGNSNGDLRRAYTNRITTILNAYTCVAVALTDPKSADSHAYECARASGLDADAAIHSLARAYLDTDVNAL